MIHPLYDLSSALIDIGFIMLLDVKIICILNGVLITMNAKSSSELAAPSEGSE